MHDNVGTIRTLTGKCQRVVQKLLLENFITEKTSHFYM